MMNTLVKPWHGKLLGPWQSPPVDKNFVFEAKTTGPAETFALPLEASGTYDFYVDWGDGNSDNITVWNAAAVTHTYASAGTHIVVISGTIQGWRFNNGGDKTKIYDIKSWGPLRLGNSKGYFYDCSNLTISATDALDLTGTTDLANAFRGCTSLVALNINNWNTSAVTSFSATFLGCASLSTLNMSSNDTTSVTTFYATFWDCSSLVTLDVSTWNTAAVTSFSYTFRGCSSLTALDVSTWNTAAVTTFYAAFYNCSSLITLDVSAWDTTSVTSFVYAFYNCSSLTALDVSTWNTASVTDFSYAFQVCSSLTTLAADNWDITSVATMLGMLVGDTLTTANYSDILIAFEAQAVLNNVPLHGGNSQYSAGAAATARAALIADHSWTITDGGQE